MRYLLLTGERNKYFNTVVQALKCIKNAVDSKNKNSLKCA